MENSDIIEQTFGYQYKKGVELLMLLNKYKTEECESVIMGKLSTKGYLDKVKESLMLGVSNNNIEVLKVIVEDMWEQYLDMIQIKRLVINLNKGNLSENVDTWVNRYEKYYAMGFSPYVF